MQDAIFYAAISALTTSIVAIYFVSLLVNFREVAKGQSHTHWPGQLA
jgi:hypothetical protein